MGACCASSRPDPHASPLAESQAAQLASADPRLTAAQSVELLRQQKEGGAAATAESGPRGSSLSFRQRRHMRAHHEQGTPEEEAAATRIQNGARKSRDKREAQEAVQIKRQEAARRQSAEQEAAAVLIQNHRRGYASRREQVRMEKEVHAAHAAKGGDESPRSKLLHAHEDNKVMGEDPFADEETGDDVM
eukprot:TRINITY_DN112382_c0_g1_i1.p1 TRINITY_DN112382_c0_g1~~TRINITY_DN112382_c0_g1_i1.p1  ORF type:complete len:190 (+),score=47.13 TRINITY_DN112382_c0_g1_i1:65-634(+)